MRGSSVSAVVLEPIKDAVVGKSVSVRGDVFDVSLSGNGVRLKLATVTYREPTPKSPAVRHEFSYDFVRVWAPNENLTRDDVRILTAATRPAAKRHGRAQKCDDSRSWPVIEVCGKIRWGAIEGAPFIWLETMKPDTTATSSVRPWLQRGGLPDTNPIVEAWKTGRCYPRRGAFLGRTTTEAWSDVGLDAVSQSSGQQFLEPLGVGSMPRNLDDMVLKLRSLDSDEFDFVVVSRGGGSELELLMFSCPAMQRAVVDCPIPVVVAVGHHRNRPLVELVAAEGLDVPKSVKARLRLRVKRTWDGLDTLRAVLGERETLHSDAIKGIESAGKVVEQRASVKQRRRLWVMAVVSILALIVGLVLLRFTAVGVGSALVLVAMVLTALWWWVVARLPPEPCPIVFLDDSTEAVEAAVAAEQRRAIQRGTLVPSTHRPSWLPLDANSLALPEGVSTAYEARVAQLTPDVAHRELGANLSLPFDGSLSLREQNQRLKEATALFCRLDEAYNEIPKTLRPS